MPEQEESILGVSIEEMVPTPEDKPPAEEPKPGPEVAAYEAALRISEEARQRAEAALGNRPAPAPASDPAPVQDPIEMLTDEQISQIAEEKGVVAAIRAVQAQTFKLAERGLNQRLSGLHTAGTSIAEQNARTKYALEFELFGDEIAGLVAQAPDKSVLTNPATWENMIAWVRGKDGNIQKYAQRLAEGSNKIAEQNAREQQRDSAGAHPTPKSAPTGGAPAGDDGFYGLDPVEREIADKLGRSYRDYAHWKKAGA